MANAAIARRAVLRALPALALTVSAPATLAAPGEPPSPLFEMIADYWWRNAEYDQAVGVAEAAEADVRLRYPGCLEYRYSLRLGDGEFEEQVKLLHSPDDVLRAYRVPLIATARMEEAANEIQQQKLAELDAAVRDLRRARREEGVADAEMRQEEAYWAVQDTRFAIIAYQPQTMAELAEKNAWLHASRADWYFEDEELDVLLGGDLAKFAAHIEERRAYRDKWRQKHKAREAA